ncbi:MAG TPA: efflux RND transporter periplasmic adaptor subunit, partial [Pirellulaceae bacterium]|nr:efflux RND transporter periplasmic adaptor subunit [Pirellulaceae bacterium]
MSNSHPGEPAKVDRQPSAEATQPDVADNRPTDNTAPRAARRKETRRWWIKLFVQPALLLACGAILIVGLGVAQRSGFISSGGGGGHSHQAASDSNTRYICPMMCTPPRAEPGRCPVCGMELVPVTSGVSADSRSIHIDPATRRVANIHTAAVTSMPMTRTIRAIGELNYDEGTLKTISAYVDGRLDKLYADYTGVVVKKDDPLALLYSPRLYSSQVELLLAKKSRQAGRASTLASVAQANDDLFDSAKERLILLGMTEKQIEQLEETGEANSRIPLSAPIGGTVIE